MSKNKRAKEKTKEIAVDAAIVFALWLPFAAIEARTGFPVSTVAAVCAALVFASARVSNPPDRKNFSSPADLSDGRDFEGGIASAGLSLDTKEEELAETDRNLRHVCLRQQKTLEFYADENNWTFSGRHKNREHWTRVLGDRRRGRDGIYFGGKRARECLKQIRIASDSRAGKKSG